MQHLVANLTGGPFRRAKLHGKDYLVTSLTLIVPGVLNGSQGSLYYPPEEIQRNVQMWANVPIVVNHPADANGNGISARDPDVLNRQGIGFVFKPRYDKKLVAEGWFDIEATKRVDNRILIALQNGAKGELSTGLFTDNEKAPALSHHKGKPYQFVARNYRPDHLAILPDQIGACSVTDGCGINVNCKCGGKCPKCQKPLNGAPVEEEDEETTDNAESENPVKDKAPVGSSNVTNQKGRPTMAKVKPLDDEQRTELIDGIIENTEHWTEEDREVLNTFEDVKLTALHESAEKAAQQELIANAAREGFEGTDGSKTVFNEKTGKWQTTPGKKPPVKNAKVPAKAVADEEEEDEEMMTAEERAAAMAKKKMPMSMNEWMETAPPELQQVVRNAQRIDNRDKAQMIKVITANANNPFTKEQLDAMTTDQLRPLAKLAGVKPAAQVHNLDVDDDIPEPTGKRPSFLGANPVFNQFKDEDREDTLDAPTLNFEEMADEGVHKLQRA